MHPSAYPAFFKPHRALVPEKIFFNFSDLKRSFTKIGGEGEVFDQKVETFGYTRGLSFRGLLHGRVTVVSNSVQLRLLKEVLYVLSTYENQYVK